MTSSSPRPHQLPYKINTFSSSNKETEDFKRALAEEIEPFDSAPGAADPIFDLIIKLLKESKNPSAVDLLNYHFISCGSTPEALDYFYSQAKKGDAVARVQLGKLFREGQLKNASSELQVVAEAFASQHELAMLRLEDQLETEPAKGKVQRKDTGSEVFDGALDILDDEVQMEDIKEKAKKYEEMRFQPTPIERVVEEQDISSLSSQELAEKLGLEYSFVLEAEEVVKKVQKERDKKATKAKSKRSKKNPSKAKKAKE